MKQQRGPQSSKRSNNERNTGSAAAPLLAAHWPRLPVACSVLLVLLAGQLAASSQEISRAAPATPAGRHSASSSGGAGLEAELDGLLRRHTDDATQGPSGQPNGDASNKALSEAIIPRLMLGNLSESELTGGRGEMALGGLEEEPAGEEEQQQQQLEADSSIGLGSFEEAAEQQQQQHDSARLRKLLGLLHQYSLAQAAAQSGQPFGRFPVLPASLASTNKRAGAKSLSGSLKQQQQHQVVGGGLGRQSSAAYGRQSFDFGLGKRPDAGLVSSNVLRLGDSTLVGGAGGSHYVSSGLGKRPSAHRFDFGLGKRVASVSGAS